MYQFFDESTLDVNVQCIGMNVLMFFNFGRISMFLIRSKIAALIFCAAFHCVYDYHDCVPLVVKTTTRMRHKPLCEGNIHIPHPNAWPLYPRGLRHYFILYILFVRFLSVMWISGVLVQFSKKWYTTYVCIRCEVSYEHMWLAYVIGWFRNLLSWLPSVLRSIDLSVFIRNNSLIPSGRSTSVGVVTWKEINE